MSNAVIPLNVPKDIHREIQRTSKQTRLSQAEVMRQSITIGLPRLRDALAAAKCAAPAATPVSAAK